MEEMRLVHLSFIHHIQEILRHRRDLILEPGKLIKTRHLCMVHLANEFFFKVSDSSIISLFNVFPILMKHMCRNLILIASEMNGNVLLCNISTSLMTCSVDFIFLCYFSIPRYSLLIVTCSCMVINSRYDIL